jgi:hypothetical protein
MADDLKNSKVIRKHDPDFPAYLNFDKLRSEGIEHLGNMAGKLWTDHNVHDPGITILEMLCYALLDLGYRTNLPEKDILTPNPDDKSKDNNFFTPAQILSCNPLTILDYRKLLLDIEGVRNAWLLPATDVQDFCLPPRKQIPNETGANEADEECVCDEFLNGLYHVYLDLEPTPAGKDAQVFEDETVKRVTKALMAHRNLCEDFQDIYILCRLPLGVCADIELSEMAVAAKVYIAIAEALRAFFTPTPRFYTLQQLLDKQKPIEEIFAGRPYDLTQSHGFVDTEELEKLQLKKEIHLSDVYHVIFGIPGVKAVQNLAVRLCADGSEITAWKYQIRENHIPEFSLSCSGFRFSRNGMPLFPDFKKYEGLFNLNFNHSGKVLYQAPSPYLDGQIPKGFYRNDLAAYYSIQNEFPKVYGIEEGGLPDDAPALRKAQALQLKGYLLFFDQLLANYLTQLSSIRSLFALSSPEAEEQHTYFINQLTTVPDLPKLLRFQTGDKDEISSLGTEGSTLVFPVDKQKLEKLLEKDELKHLDLEQLGNCEKPGETDSQLEVYTFPSLAEQATAVYQLQNDFYNETVTCELVTKNDDCVFYYIITSSEEIALLSKRYFKNKQDANLQASSVKYIGTFSENYRSYSGSTGNFSFDIELNLASFSKYLQLIAEDRDLYLQRRQDFLHHLLARFAEKFTDYALLSFGSFSNQQVDAYQIKATEKFLTRYDDLSCNRGKAYNYLTDKWNNHNLSGFEKRVKALSGIDSWKRHSLCNFEVYKYEEQFEVTLRIAGQDFFTLHEIFDTRIEAQEAARSLFLLLSDTSSYQLQELPHGQAHTITLQQDSHTVATFREAYPSDTEAQRDLLRLQRLFSESPPIEEDVFVSNYIYYLQLLDYKGNVVRISMNNYDSHDKAQRVVEQMDAEINDQKQWQFENATIQQPGTLFRDPHNTIPAQFIDLDAFKLDITNTIVGKPDKFTYDMLDMGNRFRFNPVPEFDGEEQARTHAKSLLAWMSNAEHYQIRYLPTTQKYTLYITVDEVDQGICYTGFDSEKEARHMQNGILYIVYEHLFTLHIQESPSKWKYKYETGLADTARYTFESIKSYNRPEEAADAARAFSQTAPDLQLQEYKNELRLEAGANSRQFSSLRLVRGDTENTVKARRIVEEWQQVQAEIRRLQHHAAAEDFEASVATDRISREGLYVYRLIDKDTIPAFYRESFGDRTNAEAKRQELVKIKCDSYRHLEICLGGDIIRKRKDKDSGKIWYHYQVICRNRFTLSGEELVLFESTKGYPSKPEAEKAFSENYLHILHWAADFDKYGEKISIAEIPAYSTEACDSNESIVFIPEETLSLEELGGDAEAVIGMLVSIASSYPIRLIDILSEAFFNLFPCEEKPEKLKKACREEEKDYVYYFRLNGINSENTEEPPPFWQSTAYYATPEEARKQFNFFRMLLCYHGNFYVDCDPCAEERSSYRIYLREVLAESTRRFSKEADAWGKEGVQNFICVAQSQDAFHTYQRKEDCCFSFYVACADTPLYHPCQYDTPQKRDAALQKLYMYRPNAWQRVQDEENQYYTLTDEQGESFARVVFNDQDTACAPLIELLSKVAQKQIGYTRDENENPYVQDDETGLFIQDLGGHAPAQWQLTLEAFACNFPVVKKTNEKDDQVKYCIEIKLPGLSLCEEPAEESPCGCFDKEEREEPACSVAWESPCCFATCEEAMSALRDMESLLLRHENYHPVYTCACNEYGITLHYGPYDDIPEQENWRWGYRLGNSEVVALNPQCYTSPEMACEAVERALKRINSEGLHVVEHILLRPRCEEDCECEQYTASCKNTTDCCFPWKEPAPDPCADQLDVCFIPGADPYSFIMTVVLPAWPARFRKAEHRQLLENILYREAPAHVLLRIRWLAPHDFCCFEREYRDWGSWLALRKSCPEEFSTCDFLTFLFNRNLECLEECEVCQPCPEEESQIDACFEERTYSTTDPLQFQNQINELYCWKKQCEEEYEFTPCNALPIVDDPDDDVILLSRNVTPAVPWSATEPGDGAEAESQQEETKPEHAAVSNQNPAPQILKSRYARYRAAVDQVPENLKDHPTVGMVKAFLKASKPSATRIATLLDKIIYTGDTTPIPKNQKLGLLQNALSYYLDKSYFGKKDLESIAAIREALEELRKAKTHMQAIYRYWNTEDVRDYIPEADLEKIRQLLMGTGR